MVFLYRETTYKSGEGGKKAPGQSNNSSQALIVLIAICGISIKRNNLSWREKRKPSSLPLSWLNPSRLKSVARASGLKLVHVSGLVYKAGV